MLNFRTGLWCVALVVLVACGDDDGAAPPVPDSGVPLKSVLALVGPEGGTVELPNGGKVEIPPGALNTTTSIKVSELDEADVASLPSNLEVGGKPYAFEPHGQVFQMAVKVTLPFTGEQIEVRPVKLADEDATEWTTVFPSTKTNDSKLELQTTTFSVYMPARPRRNTGVVTLPDGAVVVPAGDAGEDSGVDASLPGVDAGVDANVSEDDAGVDAGVDAMVMVDRCATDNGGCDPLVTCTDGGGFDVTCGGCPFDYVGNGTSGCIPLLTDLTVADGYFLNPGLNLVDTSYSIDVPLLAQTITLSPSVPTGATVRINGDLVNPAMPWTSPTLSLGANAIVISTHNGDTSRVYNLIVNRQAPQQIAYVKASNATEYVEFGYSVAISGDTMVVGSPFESTSATESGAVYVFARSAGVWSQQAFLKASNYDTYDRFGDSVAIDGDTLVVGAPYEESNGSGPTDNGSYGAGAAYVFQRTGTTWMEVGYLKAGFPMDYDYFGWSVDVSGTTVVVGAPNQASSSTGIDGDEMNTGAMYSGAAYVFVESAGAWTRQAFLKPSNTRQYFSFGESVAISGDTVVVGAPQEDSLSTGVNGSEVAGTLYGAGAAYVFTRAGATWSQQAYVKASNTEEGDEFGRGVAIDGDTLAVGAPGESSAASGVNGDQTNNDANGSGAAYVFTRAGATWSQQAYVKPSNPQLNGGGEGTGGFGVAIAISANTLVVGSLSEASVASGLNGDDQVGYSEGSGAAFVFTRDGATWSQAVYVKASNPDEYDFFGVAVAVDGTTWVVGAVGESSNATGINGDQTNNSSDNAGAVYVFE